MKTLQEFKSGENKTYLDDFVKMEKFINDAVLLVQDIADICS